MAGEFAKLFGEGDNQVAVLLIADEETGDLSIRIFLDPKIEGLQVSNVTLGYEGDDDKAREIFEKFNEEDANKFREGLREELQKNFGPVEFLDEEEEYDDERSDV